MPNKEQKNKTKTRIYQIVMALLAVTMIISMIAMAVRF